MEFHVGVKSVWKADGFQTLIFGERGKKFKNIEAMVELNAVLRIQSFPRSALDQVEAHGNVETPLRYCFFRSSIPVFF